MIYLFLCIAVQHPSELSLQRQYTHYRISGFYIAVQHPSELSLQLCSEIVLDSHGLIIAVQHPSELSLQQHLADIDFLVRFCSFWKIIYSFIRRRHNVVF